MDRSYTAANTRSRERLKELVNQMSLEDLSRPLSDGWTIAAMLAHLAFWDYRALALLDKLGNEEVQYSPIDPDIVNDAMQPLCRALPPHEAVRLAVEAAEAVDRKLETLRPDIVSQIVQDGAPINVKRSEHREQHLVQIENTLHC
jgi:hypothetical protein